MILNNDKVLNTLLEILRDDAVLMQMSENDKEVSRTAQKLGLALTKFSVMDGMKIAAQDMKLRSALMQLASSQGAGGKHHMGVYKSNLDILPAELQGLTGVELQRAAQAMLAKMREHEESQNRRLVRQIIQIAEMDPDGIEGALKRVQGWMPDVDLNRLLLGMQFKEDDEDLQRIQNVILQNTMDLDGLLDYLQQESQKQDPNMENLQLALSRLNEIAEKNPKDVSKNERVVPLLQSIMSNPKLIWIVDKSDEAKTGALNESLPPATLACGALANLAGLNLKDVNDQLVHFGVLKTALDCLQTSPFSAEESFVEQDMKLLSNMLDNAKSPEDLCDENDGFTKLNLKHCEGIQAKYVVM